MQQLFDRLFFDNSFMFYCLLKILMLFIIGNDFLGKKRKFTYVMLQHKIPPKKLIPDLCLPHYSVS